MSARRANHSWLSTMVLLTACGASPTTPIDCGEGGEYVVVEDVQYCVYDDDIVIIGGFDCPPALPHHFGGDPAVICSDHAPAPGPLPAPICALNPRACEEPALDAGVPTDSGPATDSGPPPSPVGGSCLPASVPAGGFDSTEVYLETASPACESNVCMVYELDGDPRHGCTGADCADPAEADARVFCSCRCDAEPGQPTCTCPGGMRCQEDVVTVGGPGIVGGYCVPDAL